MPVPNSPSTGLQRFPAALALGYLLVSLTYIFASDYLLTYWQGTTSAQAWVQSIKGGTFVVLSALLLYLVTRSVVERVMASNREIEAGEQRYRSLVSSTTSMVWTVQPDGSVDGPLPEWEAYTGQKWPDYEGFGWMSMLEPSDRGRFETQWRDALQREESFCIYTRIYHAPSSSYRHFVGRGTPMRRPDGEIFEWVGTLADIDDQRRAEEGLSHFKAAIEAAHIAFYSFEVKTRKIYYSEAWKRQLGYDDDEIPNLIEAWSDYIHPDDREKMTKAEEGDSGSPIHTYQEEFRIRQRDGAYRTLLTRSAVVRDSQGKPDHILGVHIDLTEKKEMEEALARSEAQFRAVCECSPFGIIVVDKEGGVIYRNPASAAMLGLSIEQAAGWGWVNAIHPEDRDRVVQNWRSALSEGRAYTGESRYLHPDGTIIWSEVRSVPLLQDGVVQGHLAVIRDVTEERARVEEIRTLNLQLERRVRERTAQLESLNRDLREFSYSVSHDLRAPLRAITGFAQILLSRSSPTLDPKEREYLDHIASAGARMSRLIDDLLSLARLGRRAVQNIPFPVDVLTREVREELRGVLEGWSGTLTMPEEPGKFINADPALLRQILTNLIHNSVKYQSPEAPGGPWVKVEFESTDSAALIRVRDNGIGMNPEHHEVIFKAFQRLHSEEDYPGTGIGLAIVKKAVDLLDGTVRVESALGEGTLIEVTLPRGGDV